MPDPRFIKTGIEYRDYNGEVHMIHGLDSRYGMPLIAYRSPNDSTVGYIPTRANPNQRNSIHIRYDNQIYHAYQSVFKITLRVLYGDTPDTRNRFFLGELSFFNATYPNLKYFDDSLLISLRFQNQSGDSYFPGDTSNPHWTFNNDSSPMHWLFEPSVESVSFLLQIIYGDMLLGEQRGSLALTNDFYINGNFYV